MQMSPKLCTMLLTCTRNPLRRKTKKKRRRSSSVLLGIGEIQRWPLHASEDQKISSPGELELPPFFGQVPKYYVSSFTPKQT